MAMSFWISKIDLGRSVQVNITLRHVSEDASGRTQTLQEHTARFSAVPETSNDSFTDFLGAQEVKNATRGIYTQF